MKLIQCPECFDVFVAIEQITKTCKCGRHGAKYLKDKITAVVTEGCLIFGIDNVSFANARTRTEYFQKHEDYKDIRIDSFFVGWIPSVAGEVILVPEVIHVKAYDYYTSYSHTSTNPTTVLSE